MYFFRVDVQASFNVRRGTTLESACRNRIEIDTAKPSLERQNG